MKGVRKAKTAAAAESRTEPVTRAAYPHLMAIQTRWADNDIYAHVNNVVYYSYFDTVVNNYLIEKGGLDPFKGNVVGFAVETMCRFFAPIAHPQKIEAGLRVGRLGTSSVRYEIGIFRKGRRQAVAAGHFVHVFVDRKSGRPTPLPPRIRRALARLVVA